MNRDMNLTKAKFQNMDMQLKATLAITVTKRFPLKIHGMSFFPLSMEIEKQEDSSSICLLVLN